MAKTLYETLNVSEYATKEEIKASYKKLVRKFHPDINKSKDSTEIFKKINEAFEVLSDDKKRLHYDTLNGIMPKGFKKENSTKYQSYGEKKKEEHKKEKSFTEKLKDFIEYKKREKKEEIKKERGDDIYLNVSITPFEALQGTSRKVNVVHSEKCPKCFGRKFVNKSKCTLCNGLGEITEHKKLTFQIPKGVKENSKIRLKGEGHLGKFGGESGDLYITIKIEKTPLNITIEEGVASMEVPITPSEAIFGAEIRIPTLIGEGKLKIPPYTKSKQKFKLAQSGVLDKISGRRGDFIVTVIIQIPDSLNITEEEMYKKINAESGEKLREGLFGKNIY